MRHYNQRDIVSINKWLTKQGSPTVQLSDIPRLGLIIPGVAFCAVRAVEGDIGILDSVVTNPHVSSLKRNDALDKLFKYVMEMPFKSLLGFSIDESTQARALRHGFNQIPYALFSYSRRS